MHSRVVVATVCPACSAPLDFTQGTNAIQCGYCQSTLLVTGRKQVLSYSIAPKFALQRAVARVMLAHKEQGTPCRVIKPQLYFLPYYRLTGHDLRWVAAAGDTSAFRALPAPLQRAIQEHPGSRQVLQGNAKPEFRDRYVEKNFLAAHLPGSGLHSLGVRPAVLRLELFHRAGLEALGTIVPVDMTPQDALRQGMKSAARQPLLARQVLGRMLSVIYFPYWVVEIERQGETMLTIVDAVSGKVMCREAPCSLYTQLHRESAIAPSVVGLRPLVCPNCGWELPCRADDIIFFCASCSRAWYLSGSDLRAIAYQIATVAPSPNPGSVTYLPFWVLQPATSTQALGKSWIPAFRYRRLKILVDLARRLSTRPFPYGISSEPPRDLHGCFYDPDDAVRLARFIYTEFTATAKRLHGHPLPAPIDFARATLTWVPFTQTRREVADPWTAYHLPRHLLV
jgi:LSD1 subclass zinc finger protein